MRHVYIYTYTYTYTHIPAPRDPLWLSAIVCLSVFHGPDRPSAWCIYVCMYVYLYIHECGRVHKHTYCVHIRRTLPHTYTHSTHYTLSIAYTLRTHTHTLFVQIHEHTHISSRHKHIAAIHIVLYTCVWRERSRVTSIMQILSHFADPQNRILYDTLRIHLFLALIPVDLRRCIHVREPNMYVREPTNTCTSWM